MMSRALAELQPRNEVMSQNWCNIKPTLHTFECGLVSKTTFEHEPEKVHDMLAEKYPETCTPFVMPDQLAQKHLNLLCERINTSARLLGENVCYGALYASPEDKCVFIYGTCLFIGVVTGVAVSKNYEFKD